MSDETRRILELLAQGKVTVDEADQLLRAIGQQPSSDAKTRGMHLCIAPLAQHLSHPPHQPEPDYAQPDVVPQFVHL
jgi:hypothetical protein